LKSVAGELMHLSPGAEQGCVGSQSWKHLREPKVPRQVRSRPQFVSSQLSATLAGPCEMQLVVPSSVTMLHVSPSLHSVVENGLQLWTSAQTGTFKLSTSVSMSQNSPPPTHFPLQQ
jgi:hypothetical protein